MHGTAVELDDKQGRLVVLNDFNASCDTSGAIVSGVPVADAHQVTVAIRADGMTGTLDTGYTVMRGKSLPRSGMLGITAATGSGNSRHLVKHVRVSSCP
jgi:hypothetical protein